MLASHRIPLLSLCVVVLVSVFSPSAEANGRFNGNGLASVGAIAPDFKLERFSGGTFTLSASTKSHPVVIWFTNMCRGCQSQIPAFTLLRENYLKRGVEFVAVSMLGEDRATAEAIMKQYHVTYPVLYDPSGSATMKWSGKFVKGTCPLQNIFVVKKGGVISFTDHLPGVEIRDLEQEISKVL